MIHPVARAAKSLLLAPIAALAVVCFVQAAAAAEGGDTADGSPWHYQFYIDAGYARSNNQPANRAWRSKSTTNKLDRPELFLAMANVSRTPRPGSRWGLEFGLQTGVDSEGLVTSPPPPANEPIDNADSWRHLYLANVSYLFGTKRTLELKGGLFSSPIGYESYLAIDNPNYTKGYLLDNVPYFMIGVEALWDVSEKVDLGLYLTTGYNYLTSPNDSPSLGTYVAWNISPRWTLKNNLYYGPDQSDTDMEFWRFLSDTVLEWDSGPFLVAFAGNVGTERQAHLPGQPRATWSSGALWALWRFAPRWSAAVRPEFYSDPEGVMTGARQFIQAYTGTVKYEYSPGRHRLVGTLEVRYDRSTGDDGGFYEGPDNVLVPSQTLVLLGVLWSFDG